LDGEKGVLPEEDQFWFFAQRKPPGEKKEGDKHGFQSQGEIEIGGKTEAKGEVVPDQMLGITTPIGEEGGKITLKDLLFSEERRHWGEK